VNILPYRYTEKGREYLLNRTTEISNSYECEMYARLDKEHRKKMKDPSLEGLSPPLRFNVAALRGTITHHRIEGYMAAIMDIPKPVLKLDLHQQKLFTKLRKSPTRYKYFVKSIDHCFENFMQFYSDNKNNFVPLFLEKRMVIIKRNPDGTIDENKSIVGTIDCIAKWKTQKGWRTVILDWKTSKRGLLSHSIQLSGYYWEFTNHQLYKDMADMGIFNEAPYWHDEGKPVTLCAIFGGYKYELKKYNVDLNKWLKAWKIHNNPRNLAYNHGNKEVGIKGLCIVCDRVQDCPEFSYGTVELEELPKISIE